MADMKFMTAESVLERTTLGRPNEVLRHRKARALKRAYASATRVVVRVPVTSGHGISEERAIEISQQFVDLYENKDKRKRGFKRA